MLGAALLGAALLGAAVLGAGSADERELVESADGVTVLSLAWDSVTLLILGAVGGTGPPEAEPPEAEPAEPVPECRTVASLSPTAAGVGGVFGAEDFGLSAPEPPLFSGGGEGNSGLVTPAAAADSRSADAGGGVEPETGEAIGLVADVADGRGLEELPDSDESEDLAESFCEPSEPAEPEEPAAPDDFPDDGSLPFRSLPALLLSESDFGSGFFRTTVSG